MPKMERRELAAIMFTDIMGYTRLIQENEPHARNLRNHYRSVVQSMVNEQNGRIIQHYGDGTLSVFKSSVEAMQAAELVQRKVSDDPKVPVKIGVSMGDVLYDQDGGVVGDGVNIAARVQNLAIAGNVLFCGRIYEDIKNHGQFNSVFIGDFTLKNVKNPVPVFALANDGLKVPKPDEIQGEKRWQLQSIAVLPFVNLSGDASKEYLSDGISEAITDALSKLETIKVTSSTSSFALKGKNEDVRSIGRKLGVSCVLEGSVRQSGGKVRVSAKLIDTSDGYQIWSTVLDREMKDLFELEDEISHGIVGNLKVNFEAKSKKKSLVKAPTQNIEAYNHYLKGRFLWRSWETNKVKEAIRYFEECIEMQRDFTAPYASLAYCYAWLGAYGQLPADVAYPKATKAALQAMNMDNTLVESHIAIGLVKFFYELDWTAASVSFRRARKLNPGNPEAHHVYSWYLLGAGRHEEAINQIKLALQLDPLSQSLRVSLGEAFIHARRFEDAKKEASSLLKDVPHYRPALEVLGLALMCQGEIEESLSIWKHYQRQVDHPNKGVTGLGYNYFLLGRNEEGMDCLRRVQQRAKQEPTVTLETDFALLYMGMGDLERTMDYIERAFELRMGVFTLNTSPLWEPVRAHARYKALASQIKIDTSAYQLDFNEAGQDQITIQTDTSENLQLNPDHIIYIEAEGNYSVVVWLEQGQVKKRLLRIIIKNLYAQLSTPFIVRCHRSFMINLKMKYQVQGNARGYKLTSSLLEKEIPVSRADGKKVIEQLRMAEASL